MKCLGILARLSGLALVGVLVPILPVWGADGPAAKPGLPLVRLTTPAFDLALRGDTQTLASLVPKDVENFDFVPAGREQERAGDGYVHLGDLHLRLRTPGEPWQDFSSAYRRRPITQLAPEPDTLAVADISATLGEGLPLRVERRWVNDKGVLALRFTLINTSARPVEIGVLGLPMVFDNIIQDRDLDQAHQQASFVDPYIGRDAGYLQVTRLSGQGPVLLVLPEPGTPLEAYVPIREESQAEPKARFTDRTRRSQVFEGFYDWTVASKGYLEREWAGAGRQWNQPSSFSLAPGASRTLGLRFVRAPSIRAIEDTLVANQRPVAIGIPGYVVPRDERASLFIRSPSKIVGIDSYPKGMLSARPIQNQQGWARYQIEAKGWGRARLTVRYADGQRQTVSYYVTKPLQEVAADLGHFTTHQQWFAGAGDPFKRSPAILTYDREAQQLLTQEGRVWVAGMSDEGGAGAWVAAAIKQLDNPNLEEVARLEQLVNSTVLGALQVVAGPQRGGVKKSLFYYDPKAFPEYYNPGINWGSWTSWPKAGADDLGRSYNYPHVAIGHWVLYRLARNTRGLVKQHDWRFYLGWAYQTAVAMMRDAPYYAQFGQMEGDVFVDILKDLQREGMTAEAAELERLMKARADHWRSLKYPFGSEMAWDSTGQPEVYAWMDYFGYRPQAEATREVILAYDPTIPSWGYNGNARRYWDFLYAGKLARIERQIHHYGSALNAVPLFSAFRRNPEDLYLLRVAYGGLMGGITNIDQDGFGSAAFHAYPDAMHWDALSGDYGMGFYGHAIAAATYLVQHPSFGWLGFGGELKFVGKGTQQVIGIKPKDDARRRLFIAPVGLWITLDAGHIQRAQYHPNTGVVKLWLDPASVIEPQARLLFATTRPGGKTYTLTTATPEQGKRERGAYSLALSSRATQVILTPQ